MTRWWWKLLGPNLQKSACQRKGKYLGKDRESELGKKKRGSNWKIRLLRQCISVRFSLLKCSKVSIDRIHGKVEENCYVFYEIRRLHCQIMRESSRGSETWPLPPRRDFFWQRQDCITLCIWFSRRAFSGTSINHLTDVSRGLSKGS